MNKSRCVCSRNKAPGLDVFTASVDDCCKVEVIQEETCDILICRKRNSPGIQMMYVGLPNSNYRHDLELRKRAVGWQPELRSGCAYCAAGPMQSASTSASQGSVRRKIPRWGMVTCMMHPVSGDRRCLKCSGIARSNESVRAQTAWLQARLSGVHSEFWDEYPLRMKVD